MLHLPAKWLELNFASSYSKREHSSQRHRFVDVRPWDLFALSLLTTIGAAARLREQPNHQRLRTGLVAGIAGLREPGAGANPAPAQQVNGPGSRQPKRSESDSVGRAGEGTVTGPGHPPTCQDERTLIGACLERDPRPVGELGWHRERPSPLGRGSSYWSEQWLTGTNANEY